ncbi:hypothetical protein C454_02810 [Haloferax gibbonsii ATCC 33959]|uniref:Uncharacterized protein n=1 Tax=Haloferax gibbonsii (strain ATCC 33959 / DSM 4427 / JCM 8863 / NBRC 102184 / NCIMB 2188 / Ma 2.38) TaxID=1227459 RepID=M0HP91_HALGM|nr:hypothetical protein C454_02810 [Haloferax gibbonsii ATCC 33959]
MRNVEQQQAGVVPNWRRPFSTVVVRSIDSLGSVSECVTNRTGVYRDRPASRVHVVTQHQHDLATADGRPVHVARRTTGRRRDDFERLGMVGRHHRPFQVCSSEWWIRTDWEIL